MKKVTIYTTTYCPFCTRAKQLLSSLEIPFEEVNVEDNAELRQEMAEKYNWQTVPMIVINDEFIGGFDDLKNLHAEGKLVEKVEV